MCEKVNVKVNLRMFSYNQYSKVKNYPQVILYMIFNWNFNLNVPTSFFLIFYDENLKIEML